MALSKQHPSQEEGSQSPQGRETFDDRFLAVMQENTDVFWLLTPDGLMPAVCSSWQTFTGQGKSQSLGRGWLDAFHPASQQQIKETIIQSVTTSRATEMECHLRRSDGIYRLIRLRVIPVRSAERTVHELIVSGTDITRQELGGQMSEAQIYFAVQSARVGMWDWDCLTNQLLWTAQEKALFGWSPDTPVTHERFLGVIHPDDRERVDRIIACTLAEPTEHRTNYRVIWPDGSMHWLSDRARGIADAQGKLVHLIGATVDITDVKQAEQQITTILESITDAFSHVDRQLRYTYVNHGWEKLMGKKREEVLGRSLWEVLPRLLETQFERTYREAWETQQPRHIEGFHPDFQRWLDIRVYPTPDGLSFYLHDITERKQAEEALRESEVRFRRLVESNLLGIIVEDPEGTIREANDAFLNLVGYTQEDVAAGRMQWSELTTPEYRARSALAMEELRATGTFRPYEKEYLAKDGRCVPVLIGGIVFRWEGSVPVLLAFVLDLTARKELERQKDLMLGMTGHELKTPLAALKGTFQLLQRRVKRLSSKTDHISPDVSAFLDDLGERLAACSRQVDVQTYLINDLLDVSRITANTLKLELDQYDLASIVRETVEDLRVTAPERSLVLDMPEHCAVMVRADRARISQVVTNYVTNALRYSPLDQPIHIGLTIGENMARVWVRDKGPGLTEESKKELWQRFHQIKGVSVQGGLGKGLGLGLYICQMLITQHQGKVGVESTPGKGSTFWFTLPLVKREYS